jgi:hypothetical protein
VLDLILALLLLADVRPGGEHPLTVDLARAPRRVSGGVLSFRPTGPLAAIMKVRLRGSLLGGPKRSGEVLFDIGRTPLAAQKWGNRSELTAEVRVSREFVGDGKRNWGRAHRARLFLVDARGKRLYLPHRSIVDRPRTTDGWLVVGGRPTVDVPIPLGVTDDGFNPDQVTAIGLNVEAFNREGETIAGTVELRELRVKFGDATAPRVLPPDPAIVAGEKERAARMEARLRERCGLGPRGTAVGVNLAWPSAVAPTGESLQLYARILDGGTRWWDRYWDLNEEEVAESVRTDFREIRETFGEHAPVRVWLFSDLRTGITFDAMGMPLQITDRAKDGMAALLRLAAEERVVLVPVLLDFVLADGVGRTGPDGAWATGERPDVVTDGAKRAKLVSLLEGFVRSFAGNKAVLAWDVMNEPENAAAVVTPDFFADLQALVRDLVDAVHRAGELATVGHRNAIDPARYFRGVVASDLVQIHYYPFVDTRPSPTPFAVELPPLFGALPGGWGEVQTAPGRIEGQISAAHDAGHQLLMFWSWRGHQPTGDGYPVRPYAAEIKRALAKLKPSDRTE